jgi:hypothetical protein
VLSCVFIGTTEVKFRDETKQNENRKRSWRIIIALEENKVQENVRVWKVENVIK